MLSISHILAHNAVPAASEVDDEHTNTGAGWKEIAVTGLFAALMCLPGNLDAITPVLAILFLMMYGTINVACFILAALKQPGFRYVGSLLVRLAANNN